MAMRAVADDTQPVKTGVIARPVARVAKDVDQWDVLLILGVALLVAGVWLQWGMAIAFIVGGALLALGGLWGARSTGEVEQA